jgi:hypothetical protein
MKKLIQEKILNTEERPLSDNDLAILKTRRNKQFQFLLSAYLPLAAILLYMTIDGLNFLQRERGRLRSRLEFDDEDISQYHLVAPYVYGFFFLILTIYFTRLYMQSLAPVIKDIKMNKKTVLHYIPEKTEMAFFNRYYLSSPIFKKQQIEVSREDFHALPPGKTLMLEMAPGSQIVLRFKTDEREIKVN